MMAAVEWFQRIWNELAIRSQTVVICEPSRLLDFLSLTSSFSLECLRNALRTCSLNSPSLANARYVLRPSRIVVHILIYLTTIVDAGADAGIPNFKHLVPTYLALHITGNFVALPALIATFIFSNKVTCQPILINFCCPWVIYSISYCLLWVLEVQHFARPIHPTNHVGYSVERLKTLQEHYAPYNQRWVTVLHQCQLFTIQHFEQQCSHFSDLAGQQLQLSSWLSRFVSSSNSKCGLWNSFPDLVDVSRADTKFWRSKMVSNNQTCFCKFIRPFSQF